MKLNNITSSVLLLGSNKEEMIKDVYEFAEAFIGVKSAEALLASSDYMELVNFEKKQACVDDLQPMLDRVAYPPTRAEKVVVLIDMDKMPIVCQNKLLVTLEENKCLVIGMSTDISLLLDTVLSRLRIIEYPVLSRSQFLKKYSLKEEENFFYSICGGREDVFKKLYEEKELFLQVRKILHNGGYHRLLDKLHMLKEKDNASVAKDKLLMEAVLKAMAYFFVEKAYAEHIHTKGADMGTAYIRLAQLCIEASEQCPVPTYTESDFFAILVEIVSSENENG